MEKKEYGFSYNINKCVLCHACETACKIHNGVEAGCSWRKVTSLWNGEYPEVSCINISISCMHCAEPECIKVCPADAISKNKNGIVLVDDELCIGCRACLDVCPFNAPQFGEDGKMQKCNLCISRLENNESPICVDTCPGGAIEFELFDREDKIKSERELVKNSIKTQTAIVKRK